MEKFLCLFLFDSASCSLLSILGSFPVFWSFNFRLLILDIIFFLFLYMSYTFVIVTIFFRFKCFITVHAQIELSPSSGTCVFLCLKSPDLLMYTLQQFSSSHMNLYARCSKETCPITTFLSLQLALHMGHGICPGNKTGLAIGVF